jgi:hypothetical protein
MMLGRQSLVQNLVLIGQGVFSRRTFENRPLPLKASIAYKTLPCANALACDFAYIFILFYFYQNIICILSYVIFELINVRLSHLIKDYYYYYYYYYYYITERDVVRIVS